MPDVVMPRLSDSMEEGTIVRWLKQDGDQVAQGDPLAEVETDKATVTFDAEAGGTLSIVAAEGETVPIGALLATIGEPSRPAAPTAGNGEGRRKAPPLADRIKASPLARRIARQSQIDLAAITGSGPGGRIVKADLATAVARPAPESDVVGPPVEVERKPATGDGLYPRVAPAEGIKGRVTVEKLTRTQVQIAQRMSESKATIPEFTLEVEIDMERAVAIREELRDEPAADPLPSFNDMVIRACALALREHPRANAAYRDGAFELYERVNVGIAVATEDSLIVPTIFDADRKTLVQIASEARTLAARVRDRQITPAELSGATFTVSNLGMYGVTSFAAIINPPQAAILAVGQLREVPVVRDGRVVPGVRMSITLSCDHRILYGAPAARFLARIRELLERPVSLLL